MSEREYKITYENSWENYSFHADGEGPLHNIFKVSINGTDYDAEKKNVYNSVSDMGHSYDVTTATYIIQVPTDVGTIPVDIMTLLDSGAEILVKKNWVRWEPYEDKRLKPTRFGI